MSLYRLSEFEKNTIVQLCKALDKESVIYLYGSRTDLNAKGGDIDLLVVSDKLKFRDKLDLLSKIKESIGDQKIDFTILSTDSFSNHDFFQKVTKIELR
jgi:predicted nucleotidyltransferase